MKVRGSGATDRVHLVVPDMVHDGERPSGGNVYDAELARALRARGVLVALHLVEGSWPEHGDVAGLARILAGLPEGAAVVVDGLVGLAAADVLEAERERLVLVLLVHLPLALATPGDPKVRAGEHRALEAAVGVVTTSQWTRDWLIAAYGLDVERVRVARPGVRVGRSAPPSETGGRLLCVGALVHAKGQDLLVSALASITELPWTCRLVGPLDRDPDFVRALRNRIGRAGLEDRVRLTGPVAHGAMASAYEAADLLVLPTRLETYGMTLTEALAHGVPGVAGHTGGVAEALGGSAGGAVPGMLVTPGDPKALGRALRRWLTEPRLRQQLRAAAAARRLALGDWSTTAELVHEAVDTARLNRSALGTVV